jgi:isopentenyl diphosphate isomerase/L-lactate dehydrogenase-like FMN-dependent dehydrogenase/biotin carboxylase
MKARRTLMIIGAGLMQIPAIRIAREMGLKTLVTDYNQDAEGFKYADASLVISTRDIDGTVRTAREYSRKDRIDGVITVGTDASMTVAAVANALGLPGIKFENAEAAANKLKMRKRFRKFRVPSPDFYETWTFEDAKRNVRKLGYPLVVKPSDNMGSRGVSKVVSADQLEQAFNHAKTASPSGEVVMEEYMQGDELSVDALVWDGKVYVCGIADRIIGLEPYFVELGHIMPSNTPKRLLAEAVGVMKRGIAALGIDIGAAKGDIKLTKKGPMIGELAARLSGGYMSAYTYPYATGVNLIRGAINIALGDPPGDLRPKFARVAFEKAVIPNPGYILAIRDLDKTLRIPGVRNIFIFKKPGDVVAVPRSNVEKTGNVIVSGKDRREAFATMEKAMNTLKVDIGPVPILTYDDIRKAAREKFNGRCCACPVCDGETCVSGVPGMGGVGNGEGFRRNHEMLDAFRIRMRYIHATKKADTRWTLWGYHLSMPVLVAPITGVETNMGGSVSDLDYQRFVLKGGRTSGTVAMIGGGAAPGMYLQALKALKEEKGWGIPIFKPRAEQADVIGRLREAEAAGAIAVGVDIDAAAFLTFKSANQAVSTKTLDELRELVRSVKLPFIVKGVLSVEDAEASFKAGAKAIVVSNHGGRVSDASATAWEVLPEIAARFRDKMTIFADGTVRSGADVFKALALGAHAVLIGRPVAISAIAARSEGVEFYLNKIRRELEETMILSDTAAVDGITPDKLYRARKPGRTRRRTGKTGQGRSS